MNYVDDFIVIGVCGVISYFIYYVGFWIFLVLILVAICLDGISQRYQEYRKIKEQQHRDNLDYNTAKQVFHKAIAKGFVVSFFFDNLLTSSVLRETFFSLLLSKPTINAKHKRFLKFIANHEMTRTMFTETLSKRNKLLGYMYEHHPKDICQIIIDYDS
jgi:hypothetical protein